VHQLLRHVHGLDPHPGCQHGGEPMRYVVPDVLAHRTQAGWPALLYDAVVLRAQLNRDYARLYKNRHHAPASEMAGQVRDARCRKRNIAQRF
jgi:RNA polymerase sigma-54 factor